MTKEEYAQVIADLEHGTPSLETYRRAMEYDSNFEWRMSQGHIINLLDMALEENERLSKMTLFQTEWGIRDEWGARPVSDLETARVTVRNMNEFKHPAQVVWRGVTGWLNEEDEFIG